jgi:hypothetical protein
LEPLDVVVKNDKRGVGASTLPTNKKLHEAPKQREAGASEKKKGSEVNVKSIFSKILRQGNQSRFHSSFPLFWTCSIIVSAIGFLVWMKILDKISLFRLFPMGILL